MHIRVRSGVVVVLALAVAVSAPALAEPAAVTAPALPQPEAPSSGSAARIAAGPAGNAAAFGPERLGPFVDVSVSGGEGLMYGDLQVGWMINSHVGVFGSVGGVVAEEGGAEVKGIGVRLASGPVFADARFAWLSSSNGCEFDDPCTTVTEHAAIVGAGVELIHTRHFGLELRGQVLRDRYGTLGSAGLGLALYF
jgi:hypothetical protein